MSLLRFGRQVAGALAEELCRRWFHCPDDDMWHAENLKLRVAELEEKDRQQAERIIRLEGAIEEALEGRTLYLVRAPLYRILGRYDDV